MGLRRFIREFYNSKGYVHDRVSDEQQILDVLKKFQPVDNGHNLLRAGPLNDGGYIVPDDLDDLGILLSPGVGNSFEFENWFVKNKGVKAFLADYSVRNLGYTFPEGVTFRPCFIGSEINGVWETLETWGNDCGLLKQPDNILQMDIEGSEWDVLIETDSDYLKNFRIILIEFHNLDVVLYREGWRMVSAVLDKVLKNFDIVCTVGNNCCGSFKIGATSFPRTIEVTFHRKDRSNGLNLLSGKKQKGLNLYSRNVNTEPDIELPEFIRIYK